MVSTTKTSKYTEKCPQTFLSKLASISKKQKNAVSTAAEEPLKNTARSLRPRQEKSKKLTASTSTASKPKRKAAISQAVQNALQPKPASSSSPFSTATPSATSLPPLPFMISAYTLTNAQLQDLLIYKQGDKWLIKDRSLFGMLLTSHGRKEPDAMDLKMLTPLTLLNETEHADLFIPRKLYTFDLKREDLDHSLGKGYDITFDPKKPYYIDLNIHPSLIASFENKSSLLPAAFNIFSKCSPLHKNAEAVIPYFIPAINTVEKGKSLFLAYPQFPRFFLESKPQEFMVYLLRKNQDGIWELRQPALIPLLLSSYTGKEAEAMEEKLRPLVSCLSKKGIPSLEKLLTYPEFQTFFSRSTAKELKNYLLEKDENNAFYPRHEPLIPLLLSIYQGRAAEAMEEKLRPLVKLLAKRGVASLEKLLAYPAFQTFFLKSTPKQLRSYLLKKNENNTRQLRSPSLIPLLTSIYKDKGAEAVIKEKLLPILNMQSDKACSFVAPLNTSQEDPEIHNLETLLSIELNETDEADPIGLF